MLSVWTLTRSFRAKQKTNLNFKLLFFNAYTPLNYNCIAENYNKEKKKMNRNMLHSWEISDEFFFSTARHFFHKNSIIIVIDINSIKNLCLSSHKNLILSALFDMMPRWWWHFIIQSSSINLIIPRYILLFYARVGEVAVIEEHHSCIFSLSKMNPKSDLFFYDRLGRISREANFYLNPYAAHCRTWL